MNRKKTIAAAFFAFLIVLFATFSSPDKAIVSQAIHLTPENVAVGLGLGVVMFVVAAYFLLRPLPSR